MSSCVCEGACVSPRTPCLYMHLCVEVRVSFYGTTHLFKRIGSFPGLDFAKNARLAGHQGLGSTCPCLPMGGVLHLSQCTGILFLNVGFGDEPPVLKLASRAFCSPRRLPGPLFSPHYVQLFGGGAVILREIWT